MQRALNIKNFKTFTEQARGHQVTEISVERSAGPKGVRLKYSARDPRTKRLFHGEWLAPAEAADAEKEFFDAAAKQFAVRRVE